MLDELRELYQEVILDHGRNPRNHRHPADANRAAHGDNPICGDRIDVYLKVSPNGMIEDAAFIGRGCAISQASASMMTEIVRGKSEAEAQAIFESFHAMCTSDSYDAGAHPEADPEAMERLQVMAGVREFPMRVKCATLAWHTMNAAMEGGDSVTTE
jgi:nitrogen fixation protein NifU and related proteins